MKNILLLIHDDAGQEARFQAALDVVRALDGHLTCLDLSILPVAPNVYTPDSMVVLLEEERTRESANRVRVEARLAEEDVPWDWIDITGEAAQCITDAAGLADLIVVSRRLEDFPLPDTVEIASEVILKSRKPVLAVPDNIDRFRLTSRALVAWDGSSQASAALRAAVPLLAFAEDVTLLEITDGTVSEPAETAAQYLSRHGIEPIIERAWPDGRKVGEVILDTIERSAAAWLVMGAFGHSRTREWLFGGATRTLLCHSPVPVFLAH